MNLLWFIYIPFITGLLCLILPKNIKNIRESIATVGSLLFLYFAIRVFSATEVAVTIPWFKIPPLDFALDFRLFHFSKFLLIFLGLFTLLTTLYSTGYFRNKQISFLYYPFILWTLAAASTIVLANNLFVLLIGWEIATLLLFFLIAMGRGKSAAMAAGKTFAILGFTDVALLFGVIAVPLVYGTWNISALNISVSDPISIIIFLLFFTAAIAKAGAMPFHSWIPDVSQQAPLPVVALIPAALDKLLGIYLLARISLSIFSPNFEMLMTMLVIGSVTLIFANLMALMQQDLRKFLGFATVTQVGYMLIGFGTGTTIGIMGGLFHMLNHAIYKSLLFWGVGIIERESGTTDMNKLGGLARLMPLTFTLMTIGIFAASGIPPFNAFISKWMIYQGTLSGGFPAFMIIAMFGSALTLATFLKMWSSTFLGIKNPDLPDNIKDGSILTQIPIVVPAILCVVFGVFAQFPLNKFIAPILGQNISSLFQTINIGTAFFNPTLATIFLLLGLFIGALFYFVSRISYRQVDSLFIGGEELQVQDHRILAEHMYETFSKFKILGGLLREGQKGVVDIYNISGNLGLIGVNILKKFHDGVLSTYLAWCIIGLGVLSFILMVL